MAPKPDSGTHFDDLGAWRSWLETNGTSESEIWMRFYKKPRTSPTISYRDAVEEALCWGWIDSLIRRIDDDAYVRKFTPRKSGSNWSASNRERVGRLLAEGRMQPPGLATIEGIDLDARPANPATAAPIDAPEVFSAALDRNPAARATFDALPPSHKKRYIGWILQAKRDETRLKRATEAVAMLAEGKRLEGK